MRTGTWSSCVGLTGVKTGSFNGAPVSAETSRAIPNTDRLCARLGVSLSVNSVSSSFSASRRFMPTGVSAGSSSRPPWSSASFSSLAEHSMP